MNTQFWLRGPHSELHCHSDAPLFLPQNTKNSGVRIYGLLLYFRLLHMGTWFADCVFLLEHYGHHHWSLFCGRRCGADWNLAALFNADWYAVVVPFDGMVFTFGARGIALWLAHMVDRAEEKRLKIIAGEIAR
jgi:hypothetical protein